jgi:hypothetical protein
MGSAFNWFTVAHSALEILARAVQYNKIQVIRLRGTESYLSYSHQRPFNVKQHVDEQPSLANDPLTAPPQPSYLPHESWPRQPEVAIVTSISPPPAPLELNSKLTPFPANTENRPSAADLEAGVYSFERDASSTLHLPPSNPGTTPLDVRLNSHSGFLFYLKSYSAGTHVQA